MRKLALFAAVVGLISCIGISAEAQTWSTGAVQASHYVGPSTASTKGAAGGIVGMNALCQAKWGVTAHMCHADEYFASAALAKGKQTATMWLQPSLSNCFYNTGVGEIYCYVPSVGIEPEAGWDATCSRWESSSNSYTGAAVIGTSTDGAYYTALGCGTSAPVACCAQ